MGTFHPCPNETEGALETGVSQRCSRVIGLSGLIGSWGLHCVPRAVGRGLLGEARVLGVPEVHMCPQGQAVEVGEAQAWS